MPATGEKDRDNRTGEKQVAVSRTTREEANAILARTDWDKYWEEVSDRVAQEVDAYEVARARSLEEATHQVFL